MANLTITVDPETLKRARIKALEQGTSVNKVLREYLDAYAGRPEDTQRQREAMERLFALAKEAGPRSGDITWKREDLYDRTDRDEPAS